MCLSSIEKRGLKLSGVGWKVFEIFGNRYSASNRVRTAETGQKLQNVYNCRDKPVLVGRWLTAKRRLVTAFNYKVAGGSFQYQSGFHILLKEPDKLSISNHDCGCYVVVRKVRFKCGRIIGTQHDDKIVVADEMLVFPVRK